MGFYRSLSPLEATYVATETPEHTPFTNQYIVEGIGNLDLEQWKSASIKVSKVNPGLNLQLKGFWGWRYWDHSDTTPRVTKITTDWDGLSSENAPDIFRPFDSRKGPNAEIILIENPNAPAKVLFRTHHAITDGMGMAHWIKECFRALRNEPLLGSTGTVNEWDIAKQNQIPESLTADGNCISLSPISKNPEERYCRWIRCDWPGKHSKVVPKLILASSTVAKNRHGNDSKTLFRIPSDLRKYTEAESDFTMANASGAFDIETTDKSTVKSIQSAIIKGMRDKSDLAVFPSKMYLANWLPKAMFNAKAETIKNTHSSGRYRMTGTISYLGALSLEPFSYEGFIAKGRYGVPISLENRGIFIGASNTKDMLSFSLGAPKALVTHEELIELGNELQEAYNAL